MEGERFVKESPNIAAIVLNWNRAGDTLECVVALRANKDARLSVIVVDNDSTDSSWKQLQHHLAATDVALLQSGANLGYAGGNNVGIRAALDYGADYVWILNNDTIVHPLCLDELLKAAKKYPRAGVFVPKVLYKDHPQIIYYAGGEYDPGRAQAQHWGVGAQDGERFDISCEVTFANGCSLFVRREIFEQLGLLDERYFMYWDDAEFSRRTLRGGYKIRFVPKARVWHEEMASSGGSGGWSPTYGYYKTRNRLWYIREEHHGWVKVSAYAWTVPLMLRRFAGIVGRRENLWREKLITEVRGLRDGVLKRPKSGRAELVRD
jgi:GT2 family glycosyltransferase